MDYEEDSVSVFVQAPYAITCINILFVCSIYQVLAAIPGFGDNKIQYRLTPEDGMWLPGRGH